MKYFGCAYYPEYWGKERFRVDAALMQAAGINLVRIGEFAWSRLEPEEGRFTFDCLRECLDVMTDHGISVILCTPSATPPAWLTSAWPDSLLMKPDGRRMEHGIRRHYCYTSDTYRRHVRRIVARLIDEYGRHPALVGWQIDNEPDIGEQGACHCPACQAAFQAWLKQRYGSVAELNRRWGTGFWSLDYADWRQITLADPAKHQASSRKLDSSRFVSHQLSDFILEQARQIKAALPDTIVSTNLNGSLFTKLDYFRIFEAMDVAMKDLYFDICTMDVNALIMNQMRSFKPGRAYWLTETGAGAVDHSRPGKPGQFRAWLFSNWAHGGEAHVVFRWRSCLSGQEQELQGLLEHSGHPGHRYRTARQAFGELRTIASQLGELALPQAAVAFIHDYEVQWAYDGSVIRSEIDYEQNFCRLHRRFYERQVAVDVLPPHGDLPSYRLVVLPSLMAIDTVFAARLKTYVEQGGVVLSVGQLALRDGNANYLDRPAPDGLGELFGLTVHGGMYLVSQVAVDESWTGLKRHFSIGVAGDLAGQALTGQASGWLGDLEAGDCTVLLAVTEDSYTGQPAVCAKATGSGWAIHAAATVLDDELESRLVAYALDRAGIVATVDAPLHVEHLQRGGVHFFINHRDVALSVPAGEAAAGEVVLGRISDGRVELEPFGVAIVRSH